MRIRDVFFVLFFFSPDIVSTRSFDPSLFKFNYRVNIPFIVHTYGVIVRVVFFKCILFKVSNDGFIFLFPSGQVEHSSFPAAVPLWSFLCLHQTEGAGMSQPRLDCRVCHTETEVQDSQLHTHLSGYKLTVKTNKEYVWRKSTMFTGIFVIKKCRISNCM